LGFNKRSIKPNVLNKLGYSHKALRKKNPSVLTILKREGRFRFQRKILQFQCLCSVGTFFKVALK
jgi:hypothetical protein